MDTAPIEKGNVNSKSNGARGWIFGYFVEPTSPFHTGDFEIKWLESPKGDKKEIPKANATARSVCILVSGKFRLDFPTLGRSEVLEKKGDYVFYDRGIPHSWEALEETLTITVRWPSVPGDQ